MRSNAPVPTSAAKETNMRLGLTIGYSGAKTALDMPLIEEADRLGFYSVWSAEAYGADAVTPLAWIAARTKQIHVASGIMQMPARTPAMTAMTATTLLPASPSSSRCSRSTSAAWARAGRTSTTTTRSRWGFEEAAEKIQDLYLDGKKDEAIGRRARRTGRRGVAGWSEGTHPRSPGRVARVERHDDDLRRDAGRSAARAGRRVSARGCRRAVGRCQRRAGSCH